MTATPTDPMALFRAAVSQWETLANDYGSKLLARPEAAQAMQGVTAVNLQIQAAMQEHMAKALAAANMPSKADIEALGVRLGATEAALARIESGGNAAQQSRPKPPRTRTPPLRQ